jgi:hypothetical protein
MQPTIRRDSKARGGLVLDSRMWSSGIPWHEDNLDGAGWQGSRRLQPRFTWVTNYLTHPRCADSFLPARNAHRLNSTELIHAISGRCECLPSAMRTHTNSGRTGGCTCIQQKC